MKITETIKDLRQAYEEPIKINPSFAPTMSKLYELFDLYWASKYRDNEEDELGYKKAFFNIINFPVLVASKMCDLDTKSIRLLAQNSASYWPAWFLTQELKNWLKDQHFSRELNKYTLNWPKYGHLWVKKVGTEVKFVPPQNMIFDPLAVDLSKVPNIEKHSYSLEEIEDKDWENIDQVKQQNKDEAEVLETWFPGLKGENYFIMDKKSEAILFYDKRDRPWKDLPFDKVPGRAAGVGQMEANLEDQIYLNRITNYKSEGLHWSSKHIFQTRDPNLPSNLLSRVENGRLLTANSEISPVVNEERNLAAYKEEEVKWLENALRKTFAREPITGGRAPAGTPLGSTQLQVAMATGYFKQKKEELASFIKEILWDWVIPEFKNKRRKEHTLLVNNLIMNADEGSEKFFNVLVNNNLKKRVLDLWNKGKVVGEKEKEILRGIISEKLKGQELNLPRGYYDNLDMKVDIVITGETIDTGSRLTTLQTIFQIIGANPAILRDKRASKILQKMTDLAGINPKELGLTEETTSVTEASETVAGKGGSVAAPNVPQFNRAQTPVRT